MTKEFTHAFFEEVRSRNKAKFIEIVTAEIQKEQSKENGVSIPAFLEAENAYHEFKNAGLFDEFGRLK